MLILQALVRSLISNNQLCFIADLSHIASSVRSFRSNNQHCFSSDLSHIVNPCMIINFKYYFVLVLIYLILQRPC